MWLWKTVNNTQYHRYSIGEKIRYYQGRLNDSDPKIREKAKTNLYRLSCIANGKESFLVKFLWLKTKNLIHGQMIQNLDVLFVLALIMVI